MITTHPGWTFLWFMARLIIEQFGKAQSETGIQRHCFSSQLVGFPPNKTKEHVVQVQVQSIRPGGSRFCNPTQHLLDLPCHFAVKITWSHTDAWPYDLWPGVGWLIPRWCDWFLGWSPCTNYFSLFLVIDWSITYWIGFQWRKTKAQLWGWCFHRKQLEGHLVFQKRAL